MALPRGDFRHEGGPAAYGDLLCFSPGLLLDGTDRAVSGFWFRSGGEKWYKRGVDQLRVSVTSGDSYTVIALAGESDVYTYDQLRGALESEAAKRVSLLIVDLSGLEFMDSSGVQVLLDTRVMMGNRGDKLALAGPQNTVARVLNLVGADQLIPVYASVEEAQAGTRLC